VGGEEGIGAAASVRRSSTSESASFTRARSSSTLIPISEAISS
jgi:hypothetical protein